MLSVARRGNRSWDIDPDHSVIEFRVAHMLVSKTSGRFMDYRGFVEMDDTAKTFKAIEATIQGSLDQHEPRKTRYASAQFRFPGRQTVPDDHLQNEILSERRGDTIKLSGPSSCVA